MSELIHPPLSTIKVSKFKNLTRKQKIKKKMNENALAKNLINKTS